MGFFLPIFYIILIVFLLRDGKMWMYENRFQRCRYGDPLYIAESWSGVPDNIDGFAQLVWEEGSQWKILTYFYKGNYSDLCWSVIQVCYREEHNIKCIF